MSARHIHAEEMIELGCTLWGDVNQRLSTRSNIRFGSNGSKSLDLDKGEWFDHEDGKGGGYATLYFKVHGHYPETNGHKAEIAAVYDYHAAEGRLLFQVVRKIPKTFVQRRPDGQGGWIWNMNGVARIPYHLPELLAAPPDATIWIAEGEKDVDRLRTLGLTATTNPGGAGKWRKDYNQHFRGRPVVVLPDNDPQATKPDGTLQFHPDGRPVLPGQDHAADVARQLRGVAASVKVLMLPNLPTKGDVADWLAAGGTVEELDRLAREAPEWSEPSPKDEQKKTTGEGDSEANTKLDKVIAELNQKYFVVCEAGKTLIFSPQHDPVLNRRYYHRMSFNDFRNLYMNRFVKVGDEWRPLANVWLKHRDRCQYVDGVVFDPSGRPTPPDVLNLWNGFAYRPVPGDWGLLRAHIRDVICSGVGLHFNYLMGWMARMIQYPAQMGEVAVVMRGGEGVGKGTLGKILRRLLGQHGVHISQAKHLVGNFNAHLRDAILLFADEAFYAGDKQHEGVLKYLITEDAIAIEQKRIDVVMVPNYLHIIMASNKTWVVPAAQDARRYFVLEVPDVVVDNISYFAAIWEQMEAGGYEAMLYDLLHYDLTGFDVRKVPITDALQQQKKLTLPTAEAWWLDVLHRGYVWESKLGLEDTLSEWIFVVGAELVYKSYREFAQRHHERHPFSREELGTFLTKMGCKHTRRRGLVVGEHIATSAEGSRRPEVLTKKARSYGYLLGSLGIARKGFTNATGLPVDWHDDTDDHEGAGTQETEDSDIPEGMPFDD